MRTPPHLYQVHGHRDVQIFFKKMSPLPGAPPSTGEKERHDGQGELLPPQSSEWRLDLFTRFFAVGAMTH